MIKKSFKYLLISAFILGIKIAQAQSITGYIDYNAYNTGVSAGAKLAGKDQTGSGATGYMPGSNTPYTKQLSKAERESICSTLKSKKHETKTVSTDNDIVPSNVFETIYRTVEKIYIKVADLSILGDALMCHATHAGENEITIAGVKIFAYPNFGVWICGAVIYFFGFMLSLAIAFYIIDISFKLGLAVILLPIGVALWPFSWTKNKLQNLISIILKSAGIFVFLAMSASYALNMLSASIGGIETIFSAIDQENTDVISHYFTLFSTSFLVIVASLVYGQKLIGSTTKDYVDKFFPDNVFGGGSGSGAMGDASPMHHLSTQAVDFTKKKIVAPAASFVGDVATTQAGRATAGIGRKMNNLADKITGGSTPASRGTLKGNLQWASRGVLRAPGSLLEKVGGAMQDHKGKKSTGYISAAAEQKRLEEEEQRAAQERQNSWKEPD